MARPEAGALDLVVVFGVVFVVVATTPAVSGTRVPIVGGGRGFLEELLKSLKIWLHNCLDVNMVYEYFLKILIFENVHFYLH